MDITGAGVFTDQGRQTPVTAMTYATVTATGRTSYSVSLPQRTVTFTGAQESWTDKTHAVLTLDSLLNLQPGDIRDLPATGTCPGGAPRE